MNKLIPTILLTFLFANLSIKAEDNEIIKELSKIYAIENSVEKLAAYDALAEKYGAKGSTEITPAAVNSKWQVEVKTSPIDDSRTVIASLVANESVGSGYRSYKPTLIVRNQEGKIEIYIFTDDFLGSDGIKVTTRMDKNNAVTRTWDISTDHKAAFHPVPKLLAKVLTDAETMTVRFTPYSESPRTFSFNTRGFDEVYKKF
jgi:type VI secretion system protein VasI